MVFGWGIGYSDAIIYRIDVFEKALVELLITNIDELSAGGSAIFIF